MEGAGSPKNKKLRLSEPCDLWSARGFVPWSDSRGAWTRTCAARSSHTQWPFERFCVWVLCKNRAFLRIRGKTLPNISAFNWCPSSCGWAVISDSTACFTVLTQGVYLHPPMHRVAFLIMKLKSSLWCGPSAFIYFWIVSWPWNRFGLMRTKVTHMQAMSPRIH